MHQLAQVERRGIEAELARLNLRDVKDVVNNIKKMPDSVVYLAKPVCLLRRYPVATYQVIHTANRVERCANFVAHVGQERIFGAVGRLGSVFGAQQFGVRLL